MRGLVATHGADEVGTCLPIDFAWREARLPPAS
jgi:hypothetical protein